MKIGFTGTQEGMSLRQKFLLYKHLCDLRLGETHEFHEGDCIGADAEALHEVEKVKRVLTIITHSHPPSNPKKRAFIETDIMHPPKPYIPRNHDIVDATDILIAAPKSDKEELRSGTWATIRYAEKLGRKVIKLKR